MNKNKLWVKTLSGTLCAAMLMSNITPTFAATTKEQAITTNDTRETEVLYNKSASYFVTIPKIITLDSDKTSKYSVKVQGDIPSDKNVFVTPVDTISETDTIDFYMHDKSNKHPKEDVTATVIQNKDNWNFEEASKGYEETNNTISAPNLSAGDWSGTFNFNINLKYAHNHSYTSEITKQATCTEKGVKTFTCVDGDDSYSEEIPALGHDFSSEYTIDKKATHTEAGSKSQHCSRCDAKQNITEIPATGHKYNDGVVTKAPTCTEKGVKTFTCVDGDNSYTEEIPAKGHKYGEVTYTWSSDKSTCTAQRVCANDASHVETETVNTTNAITKEATCTTTGTKTYTATFKNGAFTTQTKFATTPVTHNYVNNICTKCGSVNIAIGKTYSFGGYEWDVAQKDDSTHTAVLQSRGVTSGYWPGYTMAKFGNGSSYTSSIVNKDISEYDAKTQSLYASIKSAEATNGKGLYLTDVSSASGNNASSIQKSYTDAFKAAATNHSTFGTTNPYVWTGSYGTSSSAYWIDSSGTKSYSIKTSKKGSSSSSSLSQSVNAVIAPAFDLDLTKVTLNGSQLNIK